MEHIFNIVAAGIPVIAIVILIALVLIFGYVKAPPDVAYIISGVKKEPRILVGKAGIKIPFFERLDKLALGAIQIDVKTGSAVPTAEYINVRVDSTVSVRVCQDPDMIKVACQNFLNVPRSEIAQKVNDLLEGNIREIVGQMKLTDMVSNRKKFSEQVQENAVPDLKRFGMDCIDNDSFKIMEKRVYEIAGCNANLTIYFNGKRIIMNSFKDYCQMYIDEGGLLLYEENKYWQVGLSVSPTGSFQQVSYVNCVNTFDGGTHNDHILNQIIPPLREKISKKFKTDILPGQIKNHMFLFINSTIINPAFSSQTKEKLITDIKNFGTEIKLTDKFINAIYKSEITNSITDWLEQKKVADEKKAEREANKAISKVRVEKLIDCKWAGSDKKDKCRLILTEGDSAMTAFRPNRDPNTSGCLALRGKSLNVRDLPKSKVMENAEIMSVMAAMGLKFGENPIKFDKNGNVIEDKTRYGTIQIYTDADVDGTACAALILNYIHKFWPDLIRAHKIARAETPIIIVEHKKNKKEKWFYYDAEYKEWSNGIDLKDYDIHYMKGLGALNDKQSKEIFQNPHLYYYELDDFAEESMQNWFGKDTEIRKKKLAK